MGCLGVNRAALEGDTIWNFFNLFYYSGFPHSGIGSSAVFGINPTGRYVPKISQLNNDGSFVNEGVCPKIVSLDSSDYNFRPDHDDVMLPTGNFSTPSGLYGILETNSKHSCLQDIDECGGELWCNKIFFPRRGYKASTEYVSPGYLIEPPYSESSINGDGTLVSPFGSNSVCQANVEWNIDTRYHGWGLDGQFKPYVSTSEYAEPDYIKYEVKNRYFDVCDEKILTEVYPYNVGIDDSRISVRDYLPLIGVVHPGWRSTVATKSCVILSSGCGHFALPTHTDQTIRVGAFSPKTWSTNRFDAMGYYLDKDGDGRFRSTGVEYGYLTYRNQRNALDLPQIGADQSGIYPPSGQPVLPLEKVGASGGDDCLFNPFKILVDVECSTNRHKRLGIPTDEPTNLSFISEFPSIACSGSKASPVCGCENTDCNGNFPPHRDAGESVYELKSQWKLVDVDYNSGVSCPALTGDEKGIYETSGLVPSTIVLGRGIVIAASDGVWRDGDTNMDGEASSGNCAAGKFELARPFTNTGIFVYLKNLFCDPVKDYVYEVANTVPTAMWDCTNYLYVSNAKNHLVSDPCNTDTALCDAQFRFPLPVECDRLFIENGVTANGSTVEDKLTQGGFTGIYNEHPTTGWFVSDCGCSFLKQQDNSCTNSIVKMVITE